MNFIELLLVFCISGDLVARTHGMNKNRDGEYIVKLVDDPHLVTKQYLEETLQLKVSEILPGKSHLIVVKVDNSKKKSLKTIKGHPLVKYIVPNKKIIRKTPKPFMLRNKSMFTDDDAFAKQWGLINVGQPRRSGVKGVEGVDINITKAWEYSASLGVPSEILVAVVDSGINYNHPDLKNNIWVNQLEKNGLAGKDDDQNGYVDDIYGYNFAYKNNDPMDDHGHGTHIAGIIGAQRNNSLGIAGISGNVKMMAIKWLNSHNQGYNSEAIKGVEYAIANGAKIINCSWGEEQEDFVDLENDPLKEVMVRAQQAGVLIVAAAGNEASTNDTAGMLPASYKLDNIISVAAINNGGKLVTPMNNEHPEVIWGSNYGKNSVHIAAPGYEVLSYAINELEEVDGTSMATPHVTGVASLIWGHDPQISAFEVRRRILTGARHRRSLRKLLITGGMLDAYSALANIDGAIDENDPINWESQVKKLSTPHQYPDNWQHTYKVKIPNAKKIAVHFVRFSFDSSDKVIFRDSNMNVLKEKILGTKVDIISPIATGDTLYIEIKTDQERHRYGFDIDMVYYKK
ncbi:MAG: S8 family serine peptidase [Bacteriovoracaceae bacterium]|nr:S8 family serine peptidase [Bacteriovoracaceae bacterium]